MNGLSSPTAQTLQPLATLLAGSGCGLLFFGLKVPCGLMMGALCGVTLLNLFTPLAGLPLAVKLMAQAVSGAFIACAVERSDLLRLRFILKPTLITLGVLLALNLLMGWAIHAVSGLDWLTSFFCAVPGSTSDIPLIAADVGANAGAVAIVQLSRLLFGLVIVPVAVARFPADIADPSARQKRPQRGQKQPQTKAVASLTLAVAAVCGWLGWRSGLPAGALLIAMVGVLAFKLIGGEAGLPSPIRRAALVLSGSYIGCTMGLDQVRQVRMLAWPMLLMLAAYGLAFLLIGWLNHRYCQLPKRESYLCGSPAGASDMALIAADLGVYSVNLAVLHIIRWVLVIALFPQIIVALAKLLEAGGF